MAVITLKFWWGERGGGIGSGRGWKVGVADAERGTTCGSSKGMIMGRLMKKGKGERKWRVKCQEHHNDSNDEIPIPV